LQIYQLCPTFAGYLDNSDLADSVDFHAHILAFEFTLFFA